MPDTADDNEKTPRWVKIFGIVALLVLLAFVMMFLTRSGHGPGRHMRGNGPTSSTIVPNSSVLQS